MRSLVVLGAGTAGTMMANKLVRALPESTWKVTVVDQDNIHVYQPGLLFFPFGMYKESDILRPRGRYISTSAKYIQATVDRVDVDAQKVFLINQEPICYDILIIATGTRIMPGLTEGLTGPGWQKNSFDFYTFDGAKKLAAYLDRMNSGKLILNVVDLPIKCPVAPLEFLFLADEYFTRKGVRNKIEIVYATPLDGAFTKPISSAALGDLLKKKNIQVEANFNTEKVDGEMRTIRSFGGRELDYDLLVSIPLHGGSAAIQSSGLGDDFGFVPTHKHTLQSLARSNIFVLGDATNLPASKAGAVAHFQAEVLTQNILRFIDERPLLEDFDGHANCFIETGFGKAMLIDFNYTTEPLPGMFPLPGVGPFTLLKESSVNHWGKLAFKWIYWNKLLMGEELPLDHRMLLAGKWRSL